MIKLYKRNKMNFYILLISILISVVFIKYPLINVDNLFNGSFLSVNAIFAGFLFTSLSIIAGILDKEVIVFIDNGGYLDGYINGIIFGLLAHMSSTILELVINNLNLGINNEIEILSNKIIFLLLIIGIVFFIKSMFNIMKLIKIIRNENKK